MVEAQLRAILEQIKGVDDLCDYCATYYNDDCYNCEHHEKEINNCRLVELFVERTSR